MAGLDSVADIRTEARIREVQCIFDNRAILICITICEWACVGGCLYG